MNSPDEPRIEPAVVAELYAKHEAELRSFLVGVLRDVHLANDALQTTFAKVIELGHTAERDSIKGWLFRVAFNEALGIRRRGRNRERLLRRVAWSHAAADDMPADPVARGEVIERVRAALDSLPPEQKLVVCMRIYHDKTFARIAEELRVPLGTVLSRMQLAIRKLRDGLDRNL